jgi:hypothetical protein
LKLVNRAGLKNVEFDYKEKIVSFAKGKSMMLREAIRILMQSPIYFRMSPAERKILVQEFCDLYGDVQVTP